MPMFHATYADRLPSILRHGLGGASTTRNFPDAEPGIYLAEDPIMAVSFLVEHAESTMGGGLSPPEALATFRVIVVDDGRVDRARLRRDPQVDRDDLGVWVYEGVLDATGLAVIGVDAVLADMARGAATTNEQVDASMAGARLPDG